MSTTRILALFAITTAAIANCPIPSRAQSTPAAIQTDSVSIHLTLQKSTYAVGEKPIAVMAINNDGSSAIWFSNNRHLERIHVTRKDGEPPKTELYRHILGDFRSGDGPDLLSGPVAGRSIGWQDSEKYDLTGYYDLSTPGDYSVYIEIYDPRGPQDGSGLWLRTNTASFQIQAQ